MEKAVGVFIAGITGVFTGMGLLYLSIKLITFLTKRFEETGEKQ